MRGIAVRILLAASIALQVPSTMAQPGPTDNSATSLPAQESKAARTDNDTKTQALEGFVQEKGASLETAPSAALKGNLKDSSGALQGFVEEKRTGLDSLQGLKDSSTALKGNLQDRDNALQGNVQDRNANLELLQGLKDPNALKGSAKDSNTLKGRVEDKSKLDLILRHGIEDSLGKSVKVLNGQESAAIIQGQTQDASLDTALDVTNFNLPTRRMTPQSDYNDSTSWQTNMATHRLSINPPLQPFPWSIGGWSINNYWGTGNGDLSMTRWDINGWSLRRGPYGSAEWNDYSINQQRARANLSYPNGYGSLNTAPVRPLPSYPWSIHQLPPAQPAYSEQNISWDEWYRRISNGLYKNWTDRGEHPGEATLRITVSLPRKIEAQILRCNNPAPIFKTNLMKAIASLNGSAILDFPNMSQRQAVTFDSLFTAGLDTRPGASSDRSGEIEKIRTRRK